MRLFISRTESITSRASLSVTAFGDTTETVPVMPGSTSMFSPRSSDMKRRNLTISTSLKLSWTRPEARISFAACMRFSSSRSGSAARAAWHGESEIAAAVNNI